VVKAGLIAAGLAALTAGSTAISGLRRENAARNSWSRNRGSALSPLATNPRKSGPPPRAMSLPSSGGPGPRRTPSSRALGSTGSPGGSPRRGVRQAADGRSSSLGRARRRSQEAHEARQGDIVLDRLTRADPAPRPASTYPCGSDPRPARRGDSQRVGLGADPSPQPRHFPESRA